MLFSIVIPTYNRFDNLHQTLEGLNEQTYPRSKFEVIVVNDGSSDSAYKNFNALSSLFPSLSLRLITQENNGAAVARNTGTAEAIGTYVLYLGDDTRPDKNLLQEHSTTHKEYPDDSVLGFIAWDPNGRHNEFMDFLAPQGPQFNYNIQNEKDCTYRRYYTSNISTPRAALGTEPFNKSFPACNWEDIELGYRLEKRGLKIIYNKKAIVYHDHYYELEGYKKRQRIAGANKYFFLSLHPELNNRWSNTHFLKYILLIDRLKKKLGTIMKNDRLLYKATLRPEWITAFIQTKQGGN